MEPRFVAKSSRDDAIVVRRWKSAVGFWNRRKAFRRQPVFVLSGQHLEARRKMCAFLSISDIGARSPIMTQSGPAAFAARADRSDFADLTVVMVSSTAGEMAVAAGDLAERTNVPADRR